MDKRTIINHLADLETNLSAALNSDDPRAFILAAKESLATVTQGILDTIGPFDNGVQDQEPDPDAPLANPTLTTGDTDTSTPPPPPPADGESTGEESDDPEGDQDDLDPAPEA